MKSITDCESDMKGEVKRTVSFARLLTHQITFSEEASNFFSIILDLVPLEDLKNL